MEIGRTSAFGLLGLWVAACSPNATPYAGFLDAPVAAVASQVAGRVEVISVHEGDVVKKDQVLAQLDAREPKAKLAEAQARLEQARAALKDAEASPHAPSAGEARAAVATAEAALDVAKVQVAEAQVLSPFDGVVVQRDLEPGEWAAAGTPVVTVEDRAQLWVRLDVEETKLQGLALGNPADVHVLADLRKSYAGRVVEIGAEADFAVNRDVKRGRPDLRTFLVRVAIQDPDASLRPGMTAEVSIPALSAPRGGDDRAAR